jgi:ferredoxin-NADP reductase
MRWRPARLVDRVVETPSATTLVIEVPDWPGHLAGQHIDVRLTAEDGYRAQRSYSLATVADHDRITITVQVLAAGEVSPFLARDLRVSDELEVRGPLGGWFVWRAAQAEPILLVAGGSGVVPLMAMVRARAEANSRAPFRLLYSVRSEADVYYRDELRRRAREDRGLDVSLLYTRTAPSDAARPARRIDAHDVAALGWPAEFDPTCYVCGSTPFVETVADTLVKLGHDARRVRTERYGG